MMKKIGLIGVFFIGFANIWGQTNKIEATGNVGIGTNTPEAALHIKSNITSENSNERIDANLVIEGNGTTREIGRGASLGFVIPANTNGTNPWQQGRIIVTPDNTANMNASGQMFLQTRYLNNKTWDWRNNLVLKSNGNVGIGTTAPQSKLHIKDGNFLLEMNYNGSQDPKVMIDNENGGANINQTYYRWSGVDARYYATRFHNEGQNGFSIQIGGVSKNIGEHNFINVFNIANNGNIGIGTITPDYKLDVGGTIRAEEILVEANGNTADFVFSDTYKLKDLSEVENYIKTHKHLPDIPSAEEMEASGVNLAEMNKLLLQKVEELTLYVIQQKEERRTEQGERKALEEALSKEQSARNIMEERLAKLEFLILEEKAK